MVLCNLMEVGSSGLTAVILQPAKAPNGVHLVQLREKYFIAELIVLKLMFFLTYSSLNNTGVAIYNASLNALLLRKLFETSIAFRVSKVNKGVRITHELKG